MGRHTQRRWLIFSCLCVWGMLGITSVGRANTPPTKKTCPQILRKVFRKGKALESKLARCRIDVRACQRQKALLAEQPQGVSPPFVILIGIGAVGLGVVIGVAWSRGSAHSKTKP